MVLNENDRELLEACQRGDQDAFAVLFETMRIRFILWLCDTPGTRPPRWILRRIHPSSSCRGFSKFRLDANFDTWLYRLVVNSCLDYQRRRRKVAPIIEGLLDAMCAARDTVLQRLVREEREVAVQQVIGNLPPEQRNRHFSLRYT